MSGCARPREGAARGRPGGVKTKGDRAPAGTLTVDDLTRAIKNSIDRTGMKEEEARAMAQHVLNFFGYSERIIDNVLEPEDRDAFYMLEDSGILTTEREETTLYDGREWRLHQWVFSKEMLPTLLQASEATAEAGENGVGFSERPGGGRGPPGQTDAGLPVECGTAAQAPRGDASGSSSRRRARRSAGRVRTRSIGRRGRRPPCSFHGPGRIKLSGVR